jgi:hypothetical protein
MPDLVPRDWFGNIWYVDSGAAQGADAAGYGKGPDSPFLTLVYAISAASASNGDIIYLAPGHAETKGAGTLWAVNKAGLKIVGLGSGASRPTFTFTATDTICTITSASCWLENVVFICGIDSVVAPLTISNTDCTLKDVEFRDAGAVEFVSGVITTSAADRLTIDGLFYNGDIATGDACTTGIALVGVNGALIKNCRFNGKFSTACINMLSTLSNNVQIENCWFNNLVVAVTKDVAMNVSACIYQVRSCFDAVAGYAIAGSNVQPVQYSGGGTLVASKLSPTMTIADIPIFNYIGMIRVHGLHGHVAGDFDASGCLISFEALGSDDAAHQSLCADKEFNNLTPSSAWTITGDLSQALISLTDVGVIGAEPTAGQMPVWIAYSPLVTGVINLVSSAVNAGTLQCYLVWEPVSPGAYVKAA